MMSFRTSCSLSLPISPWFSYFTFFVFFFVFLRTVACAWDGKIDQAMELYRTMEEEGMQLSTFNLATLLHACDKANDVETVREEQLT